MLLRRRIISFDHSTFCSISGDADCPLVRSNVLLTRPSQLLWWIHGSVAFCIFKRLTGQVAMACRLKCGCGLIFFRLNLNWLSVVVRRFNCCCLTLLKQHRIQSQEVFRISNIIRGQISHLVDFSLLNNQSNFAKTNSIVN